MIASDPAIALLRAVCGPHCKDDAEAEALLAHCRDNGFDVLAHVAHRFGLGADIVWRRAAEWAGFSFAVRTPPTADTQVPGAERAPPIDMSAVRSLRYKGHGHDIAFYAPDFDRTLLLARQLAIQPKLAQSICIVPPARLERAVTDARHFAMLADTTHALARIWPHASAFGQLGLGPRLLLAALLFAYVVLVMAADIVLRPYLLALTAVLLGTPGVLRLCAAWPRRKPPAPLPLRETALPAYTVLLPLKDEAQMVPQLAAAMLALDYPALWSSHTRRVTSHA